MIIVALGISGLIVGSFINVLVLRRGARSLGGRSGCLSCGTQLLWYENVPIISYFALGGRCRSCASRISIQYPLVEAAGGALFVLFGYPLLLDAAMAPLDLFALVLTLSIIALFIAITAYDMRHTIIPDSWAYAAALVALALALIGWNADANIYMLVLGGPIAALPLFLLWLLSGGRWMGLGDAKLALAIGWILGVYYGPIAVFLAFILGASVSLPLLALSSDAWKRLVARVAPTRVSEKLSLGFTMKSEVPFGPFLIASCFILWFMLRYHIPLPL